MRPYTPISGNEVTGRFQLLVKRYAQGAVSQYLHALEPGAMVSFKHIIFNVKRQYPFAPAKTISLIAAGTGIAPIYQALLRLMSEPGDDRQVVLLYGNKSPTDILLKDELDAMAIKAAGRLKSRLGLGVGLAGRLKIRLGLGVRSSDPDPDFNPSPEPNPNLQPSLRQAGSRLCTLWERPLTPRHPQAGRARPPTQRRPGGSMRLRSRSTSSLRQRTRPCSCAACPCSTTPGAARARRRS